jgi:hypothetical protein
MSVTLVLLVASPALAAPKGRVELKTRKTAAVVEGTTTWIALSWAGKNIEATDFRVEAKTFNRGVTIAYPENTGDHTSLWDNDTLSADEIDYTALQVSVPYGSRSVGISLTATWTADGKNQSKKFRVKVPVAKYKGEDIAQSTTDAGSVSQNEPAWIGVDWIGIAPSLQNVQMTATSPDGAIITYPNQKGTEKPGVYTSLHFDDTLVAGETDTARVLIDASNMKLGAYTLNLELSYTKGSRTQTVDGRVSFKVAE